MAINLGLNIKTNSKSSQTVSVAASSGVTLASISDTNKRLTVSATEEMAGKKAGTYITEDATTIIFWDGKNARAQSI